MKTKTILKKVAVLVGMLMVLVSINGIGYAIVMEDGKDETKLPIIQERGSLVRPDEIKRQEPEYAPGEVIIKLKEPEASQEALFAQPYSVTKASHEDILSNLKSKYNLKDEKPVFEGLHNKLKAKNLSLQQLNAQEEAKSPQQAARRPQGAKQPNLLPIYILKTDKDVLETCAKLKQDPDVEYAEPNYIMEVQMVPNDPYYSSSGSWGQPYDDLWGIKKLQCEQAWDISQGEGVVVAVIDTGVDYNHEDLAENIWINEDEIPNNGIDDDNNGYVDDVRGYDFSDDDPDPADYYGHGTHVAGTIAAAGNNSLGVIGVGPMAKIMPLKFFPNSTTTNAANAIMYAADNGADVLSNSWGARGYSQTLANAFSYADSLGCVSVAAAGNSNLDVSMYTPANIDEVIAVSATTQNDEKCYFSNFGRLIDVSAPGGGYINELGSGRSDIYNILSTMPDDCVIAIENPELRVSDGYWRLAGTSMACPHVAGVVALIKSSYPQYSPDAVRARLMAGADNIDALNLGFEGLLGEGRVNTYNSLTVIPTPLLKIVAMEKDNVLAGEDATLVIHLKNLWEDALGVVAILSTNHPLVTIQPPESITFGDILMGETKSNSDTPFIISLAPEFPLGEVISFRLILTSTDGYTKTIDFTITVTYFVDVGAQTNLPLYGDMMGWSAVMRDYNNDGYTDVCYMGYPSGINLYKNQQGGSFINATAEAGIYGGFVSYTSLFMDIDNDGDQDLFEGSLGYQVGLPDNQFFLNNDDETFTDITGESGVNDVVRGFAAISFDPNNDGFLDIFGAGADSLFLLINNRNNGFVNLIEATGLPATIPVVSSFIGQIVSLDYDNDNDQDLLVTSHVFSPESIKLYRNNGDGTFADVTAASLIDTSRGGAVGVAAGDYDNDGYIDIFLTFFVGGSEELNNNALYKNNGDGTFSNVTQAAGNPGLGTGGNWWGTDFFDYDNDGDLDLHITNPGGLEITTNTLYRNNGDGTFTHITDLAFPREVMPAWAPACIGDYDNDGDLDIYAPSGAGVWGGGGGAGAFLKNLVGQENNWIKIELEGTISNRDAYGARVYVKTGSLTQLREVHTSSVETQPLHFGLGQAGIIDEIEVHWPSGATIQRLYNISVNQLITITEPEVLYIRAVDPDTAYIGQMVTIIGNEFGSTQGTSYVEFYDGNQANIQSWSDREIVCTVPQNAMSGDIVVVKDGNRSNGVHFTSLGLGRPYFDPQPEDQETDEEAELSFTVHGVDPRGGSIVYWMTFYDAALDIDGDNDVDVGDLTVILDALFTQVWDPGYVPEADLNSNGYINHFDLALFTGGRTTYPAGISFNENTGEFNWTPDSTQSGTYDVTFNVLNDTTPFRYSSKTITIIVYEPPAAPSGLITAVLSKSIFLAWQDNSDDEDGFKIERSDDGSTFTQIGIKPGNSQPYGTYGDYDISPATTYFYRVRAYRGASNSAYSNIASATSDPPAGGVGLMVPVKAAGPFAQKNSPNKVITPAQSPSSSVHIKKRPFFSFSNIAFSSTPYIPYIERVESSEDTSGKYLVIEGKNFAKKKGLKVYLNDGGENIEAKVINRKDGYIKCEIPSGLPAGEYDITVVTNSGRSKGKDFKIPVE